MLQQSAKQAVALSSAAGAMLLLHAVCRVLWSTAYIERDGTVCTHVLMLYTGSWVLNMLGFAGGAMMIRNAV